MFVYRHCSREEFISQGGVGTKIKHIDHKCAGLLDCYCKCIPHKTFPYFFSSINFYLAASIHAHTCLLLTLVLVSVAKVVEEHCHFLEGQDLLSAVLGLYVLQSEMII